MHWKHLMLSLLVACILPFEGCTIPVKDTEIEEQDTESRFYNDDHSKVGSSRPLCTCDCKPDWANYFETFGSGWKRNYVTHGQVEGTGAFYITYGFNGSIAKPESVFFQERWDNFRPDLSFEPYGISMWIKGRKSNAGSLRFILLHDDQMIPDKPIVRQEYAVTVKDALRVEDWTCITMKYEDFKPLDASYPEMDLSQVIGFRFEFVNDDKTPSQGNAVFIDDIRQLTTYVPQYNRKAKFNSIFVQLADSYSTTNWDHIFNEYLSVGINEVIIQYATGYDKESVKSWYEGATLPWLTKQMPIMNNMVEAAERTGMKLRFGLYGGEYHMGYEMILERNKLVVEDLYRVFGSSECFGGWYITEEFYDGIFMWHSPNKRDELANYIQTVASYAKSYKDVDVAVAPALWRGLPAKLCGLWFEGIFRNTPDVDILYLQDCAGRGPSIITDVDVDLPNWYAEIKAACDRTGVKFGVDLESFMICGSPSIPYQGKDWDYLSKQLFVAGQFTDYITNFSLVTFKVDSKIFKDYKEYLKTIE